tara:strand:- start:1167 stop:1403 length:237 start_codon:yes stop_codon:yes gene_type:complete
MVQRNHQIKSSDDADKFNQLLGLLTEKFSEKLYYHEIIGMLQMHTIGLMLEAYGLIDDEEDEDEDDWSSLIGNPDDEE